MSEPEEITTRIVLWTDPPPMDTGAPTPCILSNERGHVLCAYYTRSRSTAVLRFELVLQFKMGYPNEDVLRTHPLFDLGLQYYEFHLVENSPSIAELEQRNQVHPHHVPGMYINSFKHWIIAFHDETVEVFAARAIFLGESSLRPEEAVIRLPQK